MEERKPFLDVGEKTKKESYLTELRFLYNRAIEEHCILNALDILEKLKENS